MRHLLEAVENSVSVGTAEDVPCATLLEVVLF